MVCFVLIEKICNGSIPDDLLRINFFLYGREFDLSIVYDYEKNTAALSSNSPKDDNEITDVHWGQYVSVNV